MTSASRVLDHEHVCDYSKLNIPVCLHSSKVLFWIKVAFSSFPVSELGPQIRKIYLSVNSCFPEQERSRPSPPRVTVLFLNGTRRGISYLLKNVG